MMRHGSTSQFTGIPLTKEHYAMFGTKISFVIVNWNGKQVLCDCLNSIRSGVADVAHEIIVVDNGSTDGSQECVKSSYPEVTLIESEENLGFSKANNIGLKKSSGELLFLVNSDVVVLDHCIPEMVRYMDANLAVGMAGPRIVNADMSKQTSCSTYPGLWNSLCGALMLHKAFPSSALFSDWRMDYWAHDEDRAVEVLSGCFWVVRRSAMEEVGGLDERYFIYGEDIDWSRRFNRSGWGVRFNPLAQAIHFGGVSSARMPVMFYLEMQKANLMYWRKYHCRPKVLAFKLILIFHHTLRVVPRILYELLRMRATRIKNSVQIQQSLAVLSWIPFA